jgi:arylsulfatase A-like enzyme
LILDETRYANLQYATHVDVAPTIVQRLGLPVPESWEGRSLLLPEIKPYSYHYVDRGLSVHAQSPFYAVVRPVPGETFKYMSERDGERLFNLSTDPHEQRNLAGAEQAAVLRELRSRLAEALAAATP